MVSIPLIPGTVIGVRVGIATHVGIVTDRTDINGVPMVISNSHRAGCVAEEPLRVFQGIFQLVPVAQPAIVPSWQVIERARQKLGARWDLFSWNCEHFVHWAFGQEPRSPQLQALVITTVFSLIATMSRA